MGEKLVIILILLDYIKDRTFLTVD